MEANSKRHAGIVSVDHLIHCLLDQEIHQEIVIISREMHLRFVITKFIIEI